MLFLIAALPMDWQVLCAKSMEIAHDRILLGLALGARHKKRRGRPHVRFGGSIHAGCAIRLRRACSHRDSWQAGSGKILQPEPGSRIRKSASFEIRFTHGLLVLSPVSPTGEPSNSMHLAKAVPGGPAVTLGAHLLHAGSSSFAAEGKNSPKRQGRLVIAVPCLSLHVVSVSAVE